MYQYKIPFFLVKHWTMILVMSNGNTYNSQCLLFYFSRFMKRPQEVVESINKDVYTFHPYIDRLCKTNPYTNEKCLFHLRRSVYGNIYTVVGFPWSFDMTSRCLNWQLESLWWLPGLIGDIGKNCWLMGVIKNDKN